MISTTPAAPAETTTETTTDEEPPVDERTWQQRLSEAARNRAANAALRSRLDARSLTWRNRRQLAPLKITGAAALAGGLGAAVDHAEPVATWAACGGTGLAATGAAVGAWFWLRERFGRQWHRRIQLGLGCSAAWAGLAPLADAGPHWAGLGLALLGGTTALSAGYWQHHRPAHPDTPQPAPVPEPEPGPEPEVEALSAIIDNWNSNVRARGGPLEGAQIAENGAITNGESYWIRLVPAKQTLKTAQAKNEEIAGGLHTSPQKLLIESLEEQTGNPNDLEMRVIQRSPITSTVYFEQPSYRVDGTGNGFVELGPYADGEGHDAGYALYGPNSMYNGYVLGSTRSGKSRLIEEVAVTALSEQAPPTVLVYLDGQEGSSSAALWQHALWRGGPDQAEGIANGLLRMLTYRQKYIKWRRKRHNGGGFAPTSAMPGVLVVIDECDVVLKSIGHLVDDLARRGGKSGFGVLCASQVVDLTAFGTGGDALRSSLVSGNGIAMRTQSGVQGTVFPGLNADLTKLPPHGYGYTSAGGKDVSHRIAQFRTRFLPDTGDVKRLTEQGTPAPAGVHTVEQWMESVSANQTLADDMGQVAGEAFTRRHEIAEADDDDLDAVFGQGGDPARLFDTAGHKSTSTKQGKKTKPAADSDNDTTVTPLFSGGFGDLADPATLPDGVSQRDLKPREQQLLALFDDYQELSTEQLAEELGISVQAVRKLINSLGETHLNRIRNGVYRRR